MSICILPRKMQGVCVCMCVCVCVCVLGGSTLLGGVAEEEHESGEAESDVSEVCEQGVVAALCKSRR